MAVIAKIGLIEHRGKVRTKAGVFEVKPAEDGWYTVGGPAGDGPGRVRYDGTHGILEIQRPGASLTIAFRPDDQKTTFEFRGRTYEVASMDFGNILIRADGQAVVRGHVTISGVRLASVATELVPVERELAFGLALRGAAMEEDFWDEEHAFSLWEAERLEGAVLRQDERLHHEDG